MLGNNHGSDLKRVCNLASVHASCTAESQQRELARIVTALDRDSANRTLHVGVGDLDDSLRQPCGGNQKLVCEGPGAFRGALDVKWHAAAEKILRIEAAEQQIRIGDGKSRLPCRNRRAPDRRLRCGGRRATIHRCRRTRSSLHPRQLSGCRAPADGRESPPPWTRSSCSACRRRG